MFQHIWRLSKGEADDLGLACTDAGLLLGGTGLIEKQPQGYVVRPRAELERLLRKAYGAPLNPDRLMPGLTTVASALNKGDRALACIAAVQLRLPDMPGAETRADMMMEDALIKLEQNELPLLRDWDPAQHPRAGTAPNPGWFATASNSSDASPATQAADSEDEPRAKLPPGKRIDELGDFLEWIANAKPEDEVAIRREIKRLFYDVGDIRGGNALNAALGEALRAGSNIEARQDILDRIAGYADEDPAEVARFNVDAVAGSFFPPLIGAPEVAGAEIAGNAASDVWKLGWGARGFAINKALGANLPDGFKTIDTFADGIATSIKSLDLNAATYQDTGRLLTSLNRYVDKVANYEGVESGTIVIHPSDITGRALNVAVPRGSIASAQQVAIEAARSRARSLGVNLIITEF